MSCVATSVKCDVLLLIAIRRVAGVSDDVVHKLTVEQVRNMPSTACYRVVFKFVSFGLLTFLKRTLTFLGRFTGAAFGKGHRVCLQSAAATAQLPGLIMRVNVIN